MDGYSTSESEEEDELEQPKPLPVKPEISEDVGEELEGFKAAGISLKSYQFKDSGSESDEPKPKKPVTTTKRYSKFLSSDDDSEGEKPRKRRIKFAKVTKRVKYGSSSSEADIDDDDEALPARKVLRPATGTTKSTTTRKKTDAPKTNSKTTTSVKKKTTSVKKKPTPEKKPTSERLRKFNEEKERLERAAAKRRARSKKKTFVLNYTEVPYFEFPVFHGPNAKIGVGPFIDDDVKDTVEEVSEIPREAKGLVGMMYARTNSNIPKLVQLCLLAARDCNDAYREVMQDCRVEDHHKEILRHLPKRAFIPRTVSRYLRPYQVEGARFMYEVYCGRRLPKSVRDNPRCQRGGVLADEMGLGKTIQTISFFCAVLDKTGVVSEDTAKMESTEYKASLARQGSILLVVPRSVVTNWQEELRKWGNFRTLFLEKSRDMDDLTRQLSSGTTEIVIVGYEMMRNLFLAEDTGNIVWRVIVFDEAHRLKNMSSQTTRSAIDLKARCRIGLTGTPFQNNLKELWTTFRVLSPVTLGGWTWFEQQILRKIKEGRGHNASHVKVCLGKGAEVELRELLKPVMLRRDKSLIADVLAGKEDTMVLCPLSPVQREVYLRMLRSDDYVNLLAARQTKHYREPSEADAELNLPAHRPHLIPEDVTNLPLWRVQHRYREGQEITTAIEDELTAGMGLEGKTIASTTKIKTENIKKEEIDGSDDAQDEADVPRILRLLRHDSSEEDTDDEVDEAGNAIHKFKYCGSCKGTINGCCMFPCIFFLQQIANHLELVRVGKEEKNKHRRRDRLRKAKLVLGDVGLRPNEHPDDDESYFQTDKFTKLVDDSQCGKMRALKQLLRRWNRFGNIKVLIFSNSLVLLNILEGYLTNQNFRYQRLDGSTPTDMRQQMCHTFNTSPDEFCFLISTTAGGVGLNLAGASKVVIFDPHWNPSWDSQAQDRAFRIGQLNHVKVYRFISQGTIEEAKFIRQVDKNQMAGTVLSGSTERRIVKEDEFRGLRELFTYSDESFTVAINRRYINSRMRYMDGNDMVRGQEWVEAFSKEDQVKNASFKLMVRAKTDEDDPNYENAEGIGADGATIKQEYVESEEEFEFDHHKGVHMKNLVGDCDVEKRFEFSQFTRE